MMEGFKGFSVQLIDTNRGSCLVKLSICQREASMVGVVAGRLWFVVC